LNPLKEDNFSYDKLKTQFMVWWRAENRYIEGTNLPKIGYAMQDYVQIDEQAFEHLCHIRFGHPEENFYPRFVCPFCGIRMTHDHIMLCPLNANIRTQRHN